jgi:hypothetical protein
MEKGMEIPKATHPGTFYYFDLYSLFPAPIHTCVAIAGARVMRAGRDGKLAQCPWCSIGT